VTGRNPEFTPDRVQGAAKEDSVTVCFEVQIFINIKKGQSRASKLYERDYSRSYRRTEIKSGMQERYEELTI